MATANKGSQSDSLKLSPFVQKKRTKIANFSLQLLRALGNFIMIKLTENA